MEGLERLRTRLSNVQAVEPILAALRTIALGNRLLSINRAGALARYRQELEDILAWVAPALQQEASLLRTPQRPVTRLTLLVIGTERGLCGAFNDLVAAQAQQFFARHAAEGAEVTLVSLGRQTEKALRRLGRLPVWSGRLSGTALPPLGVAGDLAQEWLDAYDGGQLGAVHVVHNVRRGIAGYAPLTTRLLPLSLSAQSPAQEEWPPIIETDPAALVDRLVRLWLTATLYGILLESATAEHSARYQLLEGATQNAQRMTEELEAELQVARQEAITAEVQHLASGAGLVG